MTFKIAIDATPIRAKPSGIGVYVTHLIQGLAQLQKAEDFQLNVIYHPSFKNWLLRRFSTPQELERFPSPAPIPLPVTLVNLFSRVPNPVLPYFEKELGYPDILNGTDYFVYPCQHSLKVMTVYDLTFLKYPEYASPIVRKTYAERVHRCLQWTDLIITFARSTRHDIANYFNYNADRIAVTSAASRFSQTRLNVNPSNPISSFSAPYFLFVSTLEPRKNVVGLIEAFNELKKRYKIEHHLILIGKIGWNYQPILDAIARSPWKHQIHHLNYLPDEEVACFYANADVFVYPSYYEGFGLPVLEAMTLGAPVITSNTSSLPEVAGDAAILIDPWKPMQLAEAIFRVIGDSNLRQSLISKGKERAKLFSWERTAKETLQAYRMLL
ncbi:MAG: glycosyltransferase family 1 protein [Cyanobacteriota bacterium]|nr:glycosyltransferase family 1 protein [Cyanobacteriota bacterium]